MRGMVKGLKGKWHLTDGSWDSSGGKLRTLCGTSISPNYTRINVRGDYCSRCREVRDARGF